MLFRSRIIIRQFCQSRRRLCTVPVKNTNNEEVIAAAATTETLPHTPVMLKEVMDYLKPEESQTIIDMTFGAGGHSKEILKRGKNVRLIALDRDTIAHNYAKELEEQYPGRVIPLLGKFSDLPVLFRQHNIKQSSIDGMLFDYGCSSMQFDVASRGFAISKNGPLDMRMDGESFPDNPTAADVVNNVSEEDLYRIIKYYGEEKQARKIASAIIETRQRFKKFQTTSELADVIESACDGEFRVDKLQRRSHPATKTFQALRIFVNNELNEINYGLVLAQRYLKIGGRLVTLTFHSLEDTIVKRHIHGNVIEDVANPLPLKYSGSTLQINKEIVEKVIDPNWRMLHKHVLIPKYEEMEENPRCRSAKLRAAVRIK